MPPERFDPERVRELQEEGAPVLWVADPPYGFLYKLLAWPAPLSLIATVTCSSGRLRTLLVGPRHEVMHVGLDRPPVAEASVKNVFEMTYSILDFLLARWWTVLLSSMGVAHEEALGTQKCLHTRIGVRGGTREIRWDHALHE